MMTPGVRQAEWALVTILSIIVLLNCFTLVKVFIVGKKKDECKVLRNSFEEVLCLPMSMLKSPRIKQVLLVLLREYRSLSKSELNLMRLESGGL